MHFCGANSRTRLLVLALASGLIVALGDARLAADDAEELMIDRLPFDRITLNAENDNAVLDIVLLDLPDRKVPDPLPTTGKLEIRQLSNPSVLYTLEWAAITKIELFEDLILTDAVRQTAVRKSADAFRTLQFLHAHYSKLPGLSDASEQYVKREALDAFTAQRYDESLAILLSLYDLNPEHRGLPEAVQAVSDRVITTYLAARDFAAARGVLDLLKQGFPTLELQNIAGWDAKFNEGAARELEAGRRAFDAKRYNEARVAVRRADDILPNVPETIDLLRQLEQVAPQLMVGVSQLVTTPGGANDLDWCHSRVQQLTDPPLVKMVDFGAEGGVYQSKLATLEGDDTGLKLEITLTSEALREYVTPERLSLALLRLADARGPNYRADFAELFEDVAIKEGRQVQIQWRQPYVRPEALLQVSVGDLHEDPHPAGVYRPVPDETAPEQLRYELADSESARGPRTIVERVFDDEEAALAALRQGEISVLDQVPPWQVEQLRADPRIAYGTYRLPTVHVLQLNYSKPLLRSREFRRALCYGIDREGILLDLIVAKQERPGFRTLTGPMPVGLTVSDPVGYAYNQQIALRPYEPRLASVLATVARTTLAKQAGTPPPDPNQESEPAETPPLVLAYPPEPVARISCQAIGTQLTAIGIPIKLKELPRESSELPDYDLLYAELAIHEPLVDARKLLGPGGSAGMCTPAMSLALEQVDKAKNWREVRERFQVVHQVAYYDLPVIPLWQTVDTFAYRSSLKGLGKTLVSLYQNVADWQVTYGGGTTR